MTDTTTTAGAQIVRWRARQRRQVAGRVVAHFLLATGGLLFLFPFVWMISLSLGTMKDIYRIPPRWIPSKLVWRNYPEAVTKFPFPLYFKNTMTIVVWNILGTLLSCTLPAYAFARLRWKGREALFLLMLGTMMIPPQVTRIPMYIVWHRLDVLNTYVPLVAPSFFGWAYAIFLSRQYFSTIPFELEDAARVDGCGYFAIFFRIMLPLSIPLLVTLSLFSFVGDWNDFFGPLIYLSTPDKYTLQLGLLSYRGQYVTNVPALMAASTLILIPVILVFAFGQSYFIRSVVLSGLKG
jgi:multiple sugar transport system permease protein